MLHITVPLLPSAGQGVLLQDIAYTVWEIICGIVGVCCRGKLHGRVHQTAGEAEWMWGGRHGIAGASWGHRAAWAGGHPGVWVDGQLPAGNNHSSNTVFTTNNIFFLCKLWSFRFEYALSCFYLLSLLSSLSSWWSQSCWPGTAGWGKVVWCGLPLQPSPWYRVRPTAILQRKWPSGSSPMVLTSPPFSKGR